MPLPAKQRKTINHDLSLLIYLRYYVKSYSIIIQLILMSELNFLVDRNPVGLGVSKIFHNSHLLSKLATFFKEIVCKNAPQSVEQWLFGIGAIALTYKLITSSYSLYRYTKWIPTHLRNQKRLNQNYLKAKYGDCYAVVTGATDGIGLAFVIQLARLNIGVIFVARNLQKIQKRILQVNNIVPGFKHETVVGDLSNIKDIKRVAKQLQALSTRIDIGIVVNNVGLAASKFANFINQDIKQIQNILTVNVTTTYEINSVMIPVLRKRKNRGAIINLSSCGGVFICQGTASYSPSKVMMDIYSRTLSIENRDKIDIISVRPFGVSTPMLSMKKSKYIITPKDCAFSSLADVGSADESWSGFLHKVQASIIERLTEEQVFQFYEKFFSYAKA